MRIFKPEKTPPPRNLKNPLLVIPPLFDIEIGAGTGHFAETYAHKNPTRNIVAIERTKTRFGKFARRLETTGCPPNLFPVCDQAVHWITRHVKPASVDRYFFLYPNPYPKRSQHNKHWAAMPFMGFLIQTLKPGGEILLASNIESYVAEATRIFETTWELRAVEKRVLRETHAPRTLFEKKYLERGEACFEIRLSRF